MRAYLVPTRTHASDERMAGACAQVISRAHLKLLRNKAKAAPWEIPPHRNFDFYYMLFKQLIHGVDGSNSWIKLMQLSRLTCLQVTIGERK